MSLTIANLQRGQLIEVSLDGRVDASQWPELQRRLEALVEVRQPAELRLDPDDVGGLGRFADGLDAIRDALRRFGGTLTVASGAGR